MRRVAVSVLLVALFASLVGFVIHRRTSAPRAETVVAEPDEETATTTDPVDDPTGEPTPSVDPTPAPEPAVEPVPTADPMPTADPVPTADPAPVVEPVPDPVVDAVVEPVVEPVPAVDPAPAPEAAVDPTPAPTGVLLDRPLRVIATHWEVAAPILLASGDGSLSRAGLQQELRVATTASEIEEALARGGAEARGADLAIVPLSTWVASYEHLGALEPEAFFVAAWSRGSQVFFAPPSFEPSESLPTDVTLASPPTAPETLALALLLSELGANPSRMRFTGPDDSAPSFAATERESPEASLRSSGRLPWISTADASRLSPWVAIAPRAFVRDHQAVLVAWVDAWLDALTLLSRDVPASARTLAGIEGAPPLVDLLRRLGQIETVPLSAQAELSGLVGHPPITTESLFRRTWALHRALGLLDGPVPETLPIATGTIATLLRRSPPAPPAPTPFRAAREPRVLVTVPITLPRTSRDTAGQDALATRLGFAASVFPRSGLELVVPRARTTSAHSIVEALVERDALDPARMTITTGTTASLRVLAPE